MGNYAIIGFGYAGYRAAAAIRETDPEGRIDVYTESPAAPYNPMLTTYYAAGKIPYQHMFPFGTAEELAARHHLNIHLSTPVQAVDGRELVIGETRRAYDRVLLATGAVPAIPPIPGLDQAGDRVLCLRKPEDALRLRRWIESGTVSKAAVVGASMAGIKAAEVLLGAGISTTLLDAANQMFPLAAYPNFSRFIEERVSERGLQLRLGAGLRQAEPRDGGVSLNLGGGDVLDADLLVMCTGTRACTKLVNPSQIAVERGICVDQRMETSYPGVFAAGDCCQALELQSGENRIIGLWANAGRQGEVAGRNMAGGSAFYQGSILNNITRFMGMTFIGLGDNSVQGEAVCSGGPGSRLWVKAVVSGGRLAGVNLIGHSRVSGILRYYFISLLDRRCDALTPFQRGKLEKEGLPPRFMAELEAKLS